MRVVIGSDHAGFELKGAVILPGDSEAADRARILEALEESRWVLGGR